MKIKVYQSEKNIYIEMEIIGKVMYNGKSFGVDGLTNGRIYSVVGIEEDLLRIVDDSDEDYLYSVAKPGSISEPDKYGKWKVVEDNKNGDIEKALKKYSISK